MDEQKFLRLIGVAGLALMIAVLPWGGNLAFGNTGPEGATWYANSPAGISPSLGGGTTGMAMRKFVDSLPGLSAETGQPAPTTWGSIFPLRRFRIQLCPEMPIITKSG